MWKDLYKKKKKDWKDRDLELFGDPAIYLRKWISEAFAGIYGGQTLLFLWDYCFMHGWSKKIFYKIGLVTLMLIRPWAMQADNHRKMARVLFDEPSNLYLNDLRKALKDFKKFEKSLLDFVELNTNIEWIEPEPEPEPEPEAEEEPEVEPQAEEEKEDEKAEEESENKEEEEEKEEMKEETGEKEAEKPAGDETKPET